METLGEQWSGKQQDVKKRTREGRLGDYWNQERKNNVGPGKVTFGDAPCHGVLATGLRSCSGNVMYGKLAGR